MQVVVHSEEEITQIAAVEELASMCAKIATRTISTRDINKIQSDVTKWKLLHSLFLLENVE